VKTIVKQVWSEPAVAIGLLASLILLGLELVGDNEFTADTIIAIAAPFVSSLGIRQVVTPIGKQAPMTEEPKVEDLEEYDEVQPAPEPAQEPSDHEHTNRPPLDNPEDVQYVTEKDPRRKEAEDGAQTGLDTES
jgi:hypothetical protein